MLENLPLARTIEKLFKGSGQCAEVTWTFLSLSIAEWSLGVVRAVRSACAVGCAARTARRSTSPITIIAGSPEQRPRIERIALVAHGEFFESVERRDRVLVVAQRERIESATLQVEELVAQYVADRA